MQSPAGRVQRAWPLVSALIALCILLVGYADLWRGGESVSALLLTVGYLIFVPVALMAVPHAATRTIARAAASAKQ